MTLSKLIRRYARAHPSSGKDQEPLLEIRDDRAVKTSPEEEAKRFFFQEHYHRRGSTFI